MKKTTSFTLSPTVLSDIEKRTGETNASAVVDRDLTRMYSIFDHYRPAVLALFTHNELKELAEAIGPHRPGMRTLGARGVEGVFRSLIEQEVIPKKFAKKINDENLQLIQIITLIDAVETLE